MRYFTDLRMTSKVGLTSATSSQHRSISLRISAGASRCGTLGRWGGDSRLTTRSTISGNSQATRRQGSGPARFATVLISLCQLSSAVSLDKSVSCPPG